MSASTHLDQISVLRLPDDVVGCEECADRKLLGAPADVHELWADRLLRLVAQSARELPCSRIRSSDRPLRGARRGLELVLRGRACVRRRAERRRVRGRSEAMSTATGTRLELPELPLASWEATKTTLHLWIQIVGMNFSTVPPCDSTMDFIRSKACEKCAQRLRVGRLAECRRASDVAEHHRDRLADLALRPRSRESGATVAAEADVHRILAPAARADQHELRLRRHDVN